MIQKIMVALAILTTLSFVGVFVFLYIGGIGLVAYEAGSMAVGTFAFLTIIFATGLLITGLISSFSKTD